MINDPLPSHTRVVAFARFPVAGACKTRLIPKVGANGAAAIHTRLVEKCVAAMRGSGLKIELWTTGGDAVQFGDWLGNDIAFVDQGDGDLGDRLARAAAAMSRAASKSGASLPMKITG